MEIWRGECASRFAASARFGAKFCPQGDIRGKEFLSRGCAQKWVPPKAYYQRGSSSPSSLMRETRPLLKDQPSP